MNDIKIKQKRNSSIELLKLIAMLLIIISHTIPRYGNYVSCINFSEARPGAINYVLYVFHYFGQIGNSIFIICSAWFLCDSKIIKKKKIVHMYIDTFFVSITWLLIIGKIGFCPPIKDIIKSFFPVFFKNNWFVTCYIVFYVLHPILNNIIEQMNQKQHIRITLLAIGYAILATLWSQAYYYTEVVGFIIIYFIISYTKNIKYHIWTIRKTI